MLILSRYLVREVAAHAAAGFLIVLGVFLVTRLNSLLADAAVGTLPGSVVIELLLLRALMALPSLLPATLYIGVLLGLSRLARDQELVALNACGIPPRRQYAAIGAFGVVVATVIAFLSFSGRPWAAARFQQARDRAIGDARLRDLPLGTFVEVDPETHTFLFAEARAEDDPSVLRDVLLQQMTVDGLRVIIADRAFESVERPPGFRFFHLADGTQYDLDDDGQHFEVSQFETSTLRIAVPESDPDEDAEKTATLADLWGSTDPAVLAEIQWRAAMPVSSLLLVMLAIPLAQTVSPRRRNTSLLAALLLYLGYRTLLSTAKSWVATGLLPSFPGLWLVHAGVLLIAALLLAYAFGGLRLRWRWLPG